MRFYDEIAKINNSYFEEADKIWIESVIAQVKEQTGKDITEDQAKELLNRKMK